MYRSISIIIPFYYGNKYINTLFDRLRINFDKINGEFFMDVILVNDSPDEGIIIEKSKYAFPIQVIVNEKNIGIHGSRVKGLSQSNSDVILFLDQDDEISEDCILSQMHALDDNDFVIGNGYIEKSDGKLLRLYDNKLQQKQCLSALFHYAYTNPIISPGQAIIKRTSLPDKWINYTFKNNGADDHYLWLLLLKNKAKGVINEKYVYIHKYTGNNASLNLDNMYASNMEMVERLKKSTNKKSSEIGQKNQEKKEEGALKIIFLKRRIMYCFSKSKMRKIKYLDVCLLRFFINLMIFHGKYRKNGNV